MGQEFFYVYSSLIMIVLIGLSFFYEAFYIQKNKGTVNWPSLSTIFLPIIILIHSYIQLVRIEVTQFLLNGSLLIFLFLFILISAVGYWMKKLIIVYEISKEEVMTILEKELDNFSIPYSVKNETYSENTIITFKDSKSKISIKGGIFGEERKTFYITMKKWRSIPNSEKLVKHLLEAFRTKHRMKIFWTDILINCLCGLVLLGHATYFF